MPQFFHICKTKPLKLQKIKDVVLGCNLYFLKLYKKSGLGLYSLTAFTITLFYLLRIAR